MSQIHRIALVAFVAVAFTACASIRVASDFDPGVDFVDYETFDWLEPPLVEEPRSAEEAPADPFARNTLVDHRVRTGVDEALARLGYEKRAGSDADFAVRYEIVNREVTRSSPGFVTGGFGRRRFVGAGIYHPGTVRTFEEGTLILDVIDTRTQRIAWRGWGATRTRDGHLDAERLQRVIERILEKFPPPREDAVATGEG